MFFRCMSMGLSLSSFENLPFPPLHFSSCTVFPVVHTFSYTDIYILSAFLGLEPMDWQRKLEVIFV